MFFLAGRIRCVDKLDASFLAVAILLVGKAKEKVT
jgi:hypothetical protein